MRLAVGSIQNAFQIICIIRGEKGQHRRIQFGIQLVTFFQQIIIQLAQCCDLLLQRRTLGFQSLHCRQPCTQIRKLFGQCVDIDLFALHRPHAALCGGKLCPRSRQIGICLIQLALQRFFLRDKSVILGFGGGQRRLVVCCRCGGCKGCQVGKLLDDCRVRFGEQAYADIANHGCGCLAGIVIHHRCVLRCGQVVQQPHGIAVQQIVDGAFIDVGQPFQFGRLADH